MFDNLFAFLYKLKNHRHFNLYLGLFLGLVLITSSIALYMVMNYQPKVVTLTYWGYWEPQAVESVIKEFESTHPYIKVNYEKRELDRYAATLRSRITGGVGPDVFYYHSRWLPSLRPLLTEVPSQYIPSEWNNEFYPITKRELTLYSRIWGLPERVESLGLLYNNELFTGVGLNGAPKTWDELRIKYLPLLTVRDKENVMQNAGIALGTNNNVDYASQILQLMLAQNGVTFLKDNKLQIASSFSAGSPPNNLGLDALNFYTSFALGDNPAWSSNFVGSVEDFTNGKVAMIFAPNTVIDEILRNSKELSTPLDLRVATVPQLPSSDNVSWGTSWSLGVSNYSGAKEQGWELADYLTSKAVVQKIIANQIKLTDTVDLPANIEVAELLKKDPIYTPFIEMAPSSFSFFGVEGTDDGGLNDEMAKLFRELVTNPSESGVTQVVAKMEAELIKYGLILPEIEQ